MVESDDRQPVVVDLMQLEKIKWKGIVTGTCRWGLLSRGDSTRRRLLPAGGRVRDDQYSIVYWIYEDASDCYSFYAENVQGGEKFENGPRLFRIRIIK